MPMSVCASHVSPASFIPAKSQFSLGIPASVAAKPPEAVLNGRLEAGDGGGPAKEHEYVNVCDLNSNKKEVELVMIQGD